MTADISKKKGFPLTGADHDTIEDIFTDDSSVEVLHLDNPTMSLVVVFSWSDSDNFVPQLNIRLHSKFVHVIVEILDHLRVVHVVWEFGRRRKVTIKSNRSGIRLS